MSPGRPDAALVRRHLLALDAALSNLATHAGRPAEALRNSVDETWIVERGLQLCAQNALDIATHLAANAGLDATDYASAIDALARIGVLPAAFAASFRAIAGFRNVLVHAYLEVDLRLLHATLNQRLGDFRQFAAHVEAHLARGQ